MRCVLCVCPSYVQEHQLFLAARTRHYDNDNLGSLSSNLLQSSKNTNCTAVSRIISSHRKPQ